MMAAEFYASKQLGHIPIYSNQNMYKTVSSSEFQKNYGAIIHFVELGNIIQITRYGRPLVYILPAIKEMEEFALRLSEKKLPLPA